MSGKPVDDLVPDLLRVGVQVEQDARSNAFGLADKAEQQVLGADMGMAEDLGLADGEVHDPLRTWGEGDLTGRHLVALTHDPRDPHAHLLARTMGRLEDLRGNALLFTEQAEQHVLGADVVVLQCARLGLREDDHLTRTLCELLEHVSAPDQPADQDPEPEESSAGQHRRPRGPHAYLAGRMERNRSPAH